MNTGLLIRPIITEKLIASGEYAFEVDIKANKPEIVRYLKETFNVDTVSIKTMIMKGKSKRTWKGRKTMKFEDRKKAILRLRSGQKIDIFETQEEKK